MRASPPPTPPAPAVDPLAGLARPEALGVTPGAAPVTRIETHLSVILLAGDRAFKRVKPVDYGFVRATSLGDRRRICFAELSRNPMAGDLYLGVRPVLTGPDGPRLGARLAADAPTPEGVVDYVVEMRRFDPANEFDRLLERGALPAPALDGLADLIAAAHLRAPRRTAGAAATRSTLNNVAETLARATADGASADGASADAVAQWRTASLAVWEARRAQLDARSRHGRVRRCHGDLHLGNVCLWRGAPRPFDAIAFNDALTDIDALYDAAFALMDLARLGGIGPATRFLNRYLSVTRDYSGLSAAPLFASLRAAVRAMTSLLGGDAEGGRRFLALANRALTPGPRARLIAVGGGSGVGKSTLAGMLAVDPAIVGAEALWGAAHLRSDVARKRLVGVAPEQPAPPEAYAEAVSDQVLARLAADAGRALRAGAVTVVDATFLPGAWRVRIADVAARAGARFDGVWLEADAETRAARTVARAAGVIQDPSDAGPEIARAQRPQRPTEPGWRAVSAVGAPEAVAAAALAALRAPG